MSENMIGLAKQGSGQTIGRRLTALLFVAVVLLLQVVLGGSPAVAGPFCDKQTPPAIDGFNHGITGQLDPNLASTTANGTYGIYGYSGHVWHTYDVGDQITCTDSKAEISTWTGNQLFNAAKVMVAATGALNTMVESQGLPVQMDSIVKVGAEASFKGFAGPLLGLVLLIVGILVFRHVFSGDNAGAAKHGGRVAVGLALIAATAFSPLLYSKIFDEVLLDGYRDLQANIGKSLFGDTVYRDILPETLHKNIVENNFYGGAFGDYDSKLSQELGPQLVDAQACTWTQVRTDTCDNKAKQEAFKKLAERVKNEGDYNTFTGASGTRVGTGALALTEAMIFTPLQMICKLGILFGQIVLRMVVLFGGLIGLLCMMPGVGRNVARGVLGVGVLAIVFNAVAFFHTWLLATILNMGGLSLPMKLAAMIIITAVIWSVMRPVKRLKSMVATAMHTVPGQSAGRLSSWIQHARLARLLRKNNRRGDGDRWWNTPGETGPIGQVLRGDREPSPYSMSRSRPESDDGVGALVGAFVGRGNRGDGPGHGGVARAGGRGPGGGGQGGGTAAKNPRIYVDSEIVRDNDRGPNRTAVAEGTSGYADRPRISGGSRHELPPGEGAAGTDRPEVPEDPAAPSGGSGTDVDLIRPSELYQRGKSADSPREAKPTFEGGKPVFEVYRPSTGETTQERLGGADQPRPEVQADFQQGPRATESTGDQQEGHGNATED